MKFIELTFLDGKKLLLSVDKILMVEEKRHTMVFIKNESFYCKESYEEIKEKIQASCN